MSCNCLGTVVSTIKGFFGRGESASTEEKKSGTLSGRTVTEAGQGAPLTPEQQKTNEVVKAAIANLLAGKDPGPLNDEEKKLVEEYLKRIYITALADQVAESDATNFEQAEKVAAVALDKFANDFVEGAARHQGVEIPAAEKEKVLNGFKESLGVTSKDIAVLGLVFRQQMKAAEANAPTPAQTTAPVQATGKK